jgi:hypothetical protein
MLFENSYANDSGTRWKHLKAISDRCDLRPSPLGKNRVEALFPALSPSREELRQIARLIEDAVNALVTDANVIAYDELTDDYHPSSVSKAKHESAGDTIPVGYWSRKPHPNGLEMLLGATPVAHPFRAGKLLSFVIDFALHLSPGDSASRDVMSDCVRKWATRHPGPQPLWVADAGFGCVELGQLIERLGGRFVLSFPSTVEPDVWRALSLGLFKGYRAAQNAAGWVASVCLGDSSERGQRDDVDDQAGGQSKKVVEKTAARFHCVFSNAFTCE